MEFDNYYQDDSAISNSMTLKDIWDKYVVHLKWFVLSGLIFLFAAALYLTFSVPIFKVNASVLIKDGEGGSAFSDLAFMESLGIYRSGGNSLENEVQILKSRKLMTQVVEELHLNSTFFVEESPNDIELFSEIPISVSFHSDSLSVEELSSEFTIFIQSDTSYDFIAFDGSRKRNLAFGSMNSVLIGNDKESFYSEISIEPNSSILHKFIGKEIIVYYAPVAAVVSNYLDQITINALGESVSNVLEISMMESNVDKGVAIINNLIAQYNADGIMDNQMIAQTTTDFLDRRIDLIQNQLVAIESSAEQFKTRNRMVDAGGAELYLQTSNVTERELVEANTQMQLIDYMIEELSKSDEVSLLPGNIGLSDQGITSSISEYNNLVLQRNRISKSSSAQNPIIISIDSQLADLKQNLLSSLNSFRSSTQIEINALNQRSSRIESRIAAVPKNEKEFKDIVREQETKNALYLFLLQKREESIISNAVSIEKAKIVDEAYSDWRVVSPKKYITLLGGLLFGFLLPMGIIYVKDLLDTRVHDESDLKRLNIPYLGDIPLAPNKGKNVVTKYDNSNVAEAFRYIRTNINFMLDSKDLGKTIFVTSTHGGEGKTFTAINLAHSFALSGKKTLLMTMDLRAPKVSKYLNLEKNIGITNYVKNENLTVESIIESEIGIENLSFINSGDIPPNPVELLMSDRVKHLFKQIKEIYEYIIVDTAPIGLVTDAIQVSKNADLTIYVIKSNYLDKRLLEIPKKLHNEHKLKNMALLINGVDTKKRSYGYGYGYGAQKKKSWLSRSFKLF